MAAKLVERRLISGLRRLARLDPQAFRRFLSEIRKLKPVVDKISTK